MKLISKISCDVITKDEQYDVQLFKEDDCDSKYDIFNVKTDTGMTLKFYRFSFYSEQELHQMNFNQQMDELLK